MSVVLCSYTDWGQHSHAVDAVGVCMPFPTIFLFVTVILVHLLYFLMVHSYHEAVSKIFIQDSLLLHYYSILSYLDCFCTILFVLLISSITQFLIISHLVVLFVDHTYSTFPYIPFFAVLTNKVSVFTPNLFFDVDLTPQVWTTPLVNLCCQVYSILQDWMKHEQPLLPFQYH